MAQRQWNKLRRNKARAIEAEGYAKLDEQTKKFMAQLDAVQKEFEAATPTEREVIRRRIMGDVGQG